jgi:hypothetical protein
MLFISEAIQVDAAKATVWVHAPDGSTIGRFSKRFGMDVHSTITEQMAGASQCLHCTHQQPTVDEWHLFCDLMWQHYKISVPKDLIQF